MNSQSGMLFQSDCPGMGALSPVLTALISLELEGPLKKPNDSATNNCRDRIVELGQVTKSKPPIVSQGTDSARERQSTVDQSSVGSSSGNSKATFQKLPSNKVYLDVRSLPKC